MQSEKNENLDPRPLDGIGLQDLMDLIQEERDRYRHAVVEALRCMDRGLYQSARVELQRVAPPVRCTCGPSTRLDNCAVHSHTLPASGKKGAPR